VGQAGRNDLHAEDAYPAGCSPHRRRDARRHRGRGPAAARGPNGAPILEIAGPREENLVEAARLLAAHRSEQVRVEGVSDPDDPDGALYESGALLPGPDAILAGPTFEEWLRDQTDEEA
jgi:hypothetical protein